MGEMEREEPAAGARVREHGLEWSDLCSLHLLSPAGRGRVPSPGETEGCPLGRRLPHPMLGGWGCPVLRGPAAPWEAGFIVT